MSESDADISALAYREPNIVTFLILTSFLLLLNFINAVVDRLIYAGLLGQILIGIAFGTPGAKWLNLTTEEVIVDLGYLGLILLVYEGGLSTSFQALKANFALSLAIAATGIAIPIGLSFILRSLIDASPLQSFAAGAALCSTSLGTTFTIMQTSGLGGTRISVVLTSAAIIDDVFGLVMVQVVANLSLGTEHVNTSMTVRPILVALGLGLATILTCHFLVVRLTVLLNSWREKSPQKCYYRVLLKEQTSLIVHLAILIALVTGATYAGTSGLFAAYLAGTAIGWWDAELPHPQNAASSSKNQNAAQAEQDGNLRTSRSSDQDPVDAVDGCGHRGSMKSSPTGGNEQGVGSQAVIIKTIGGSQVFGKYFRQPLDRVLKPFFFASIGFSIPITRMFSGSIVWRGVVYATLMFLGKFLCGLWLVRLPIPYTLRRCAPRGAGKKVSMGQKDKVQGTKNQAGQSPESSCTGSANTPKANEDCAADPARKATSSETTATPTKPLSLYPAVILGSAMVARGEIGFLISSVADSSGVFGQQQGPIFLIVTWAIMTCTILGPLMVGIIARRLRHLETRSESQKRTDVLGVWGID